VGGHCFSLDRFGLKRGRGATYLCLKSRGGEKKKKGLHRGGGETAALSRPVRASAVTLAEKEKRKGSPVPHLHSGRKKRETQTVEAFSLFWDWPLLCWEKGGRQRMARLWDHCFAVRERKKRKKSVRAIEATEGLLMFSSPLTSRCREKKRRRPRPIPVRPFLSVRRGGEKGGGRGALFLLVRSRTGKKKREREMLPTGNATENAA